MASFWQTLPKPFLILAPMENVTDFVFREVVAQTAPPDVMFTEFTSADGLVSKGREALLPKLKFSASQRPMVAQIWGNHTESLQESARLIKKLKFDGVDINMGCPDKTIIRRGECGGLIGDTKTASAIIKAVKKGAGELSVSVKTRLAPTPEKTTEWITFLLKQDIAALTVHGRTVKQMSKGDAKWEEIGRAVELKNRIAPNTLIIGNGDILSYAQAVKTHKEFGADGVMIGRGIFQNPWVFEKKLKPKVRTEEEYIEILQNHLSLFDQTYGQTKHFDIMKKFFKMYIKDFAGANQLRQDLMETKNKKEVERILSRHI